MHNNKRAVKYDIVKVGYILFRGPFIIALYGINTN